MAEVSDAMEEEINILKQDNEDLKNENDDLKALLQEARD